MSEFWRDFALCAEISPDLFFPEVGESWKATKQLCESCPVKAECLEYALEHRMDVGIWGGTSPKERARLRRSAA